MPVRQASQPHFLLGFAFCSASLCARLRFVVGRGGPSVIGSGANEAACSRVERGMELNGRHVNWVRPVFLDSGARCGERVAG